MEKGRFYNWCITENLEKQPTDKMQEEAEDYFMQTYYDGCPTLPEHKLKYAIWGLECAENLHIHYYMEFTEKVSMKWLKENMNNNKLHCEPRAGTQKQAIDYVKKDDTKVFEDMKWKSKGEPKSQGNRSDLDSMVDMIEEGYNAGDILRTFRGNGLKHINFIYRGIDAMYGLAIQDKWLSHYNLNERKEIIEKNKNA